MERPPPRTDRLDSWKEIAAYLGRTEKTARRWEQSEGLPVYRLVHKERGSVYTYKAELDNWRASRASIAAAPAETDSSRVRPALWVGVGAVVALGLIGAASLWHVPPAPAAASLTLAILPFSSDPADSSGADIGLAIAEAIVGHLAGAPDLRVRPFASSLRHSQVADEPAAIGRRMGVDVLATGRARASGGRLQINVDLVDVSDNSQIWGTSYEMADAELGQTQERIALAMRERVLQHAYGPSFQPAAYRPSNVLSRNADALKLYLRARGFSRNPGRSQIQSSIDSLHEAVRLDPDFAAAYGSLATAHIAITFFGDKPPSETMGKAKTYALRALEIDASSGWGLMTLAAVGHWYDFDHEQSEARYREALAASPRDAGVRSWYAELLLDLQRFDEALEQSLAAEEQDPGWLEVETVRANGYLFSGRPEQAIPIYLKALEREPNHGLSRFFLGQAYLASGRHAQAVAELRRADDAMGHAPFSQAGLAYAVARAGGRMEAEAILAEMTNKRNDGYYPAFAIAVVHMGLGDAETALDWLDRAYDERLMGYHMPNVEVIWAPLRSHPRFRDLLRRLDLPKPNE